jgi:hypothetical protein
VLGFKVDAAKGFFFDRERVMKAADAATRRNLSRFGAFVRTRARTSIKYGKKSSAPGSPPHGHRTLSRTKTNRAGQVKKQSVSPLREFLFFVFDPSARSVVIGPARLNGVLGDAPHALEHGGESAVATGRRGAPTRRVVVRARPFMRPAFAAELPGLDKLWKDSVRG